MRLVFSIRTADRSPGPNYVWGTVRQLVEQGVDEGRIHVCATSPDIAWLKAEVHWPGVVLYAPAHRLSPNANGLEMIRVVEPEMYDWILLLEDDLGFCADFEGSVRRWLTKCARPERHVYRFFGFDLRPNGKAAYDWPLAGLRGSQAIALRTEDARDFLIWGDAHLHNWTKFAAPDRRPKDPSASFDKFLATWALQRWPKQPGVVSHPLFVRHLGIKSLIHERAVGNDALFAGAKWSFA